MPVFDYSGQLVSGAALQGTLEAASREEAEAALIDMGVRVTTLHPARRMPAAAPLSLDDFQFLNERVAALTAARIPLHDGLRQLAADVGGGRLKRVVLELAAELERGVPIDRAVAALRGRFPGYYGEVVAAGLRSGDVSGTLYGLATALRLRSSMGRVLLELAAYPLAVLTLALVVTSFLMRAVVPMIAELLAEMQAMLGPTNWRGVPRAGPGVWTQAVVGMADVWPVCEAVAIGVLALAVLLVLSSLTPYGGGLREFLLRHLPGFSQVFRSSALARLAHSAALGAYAGLPLHELVAVAGAASGSGRVRAACERAAERLRGGADFERAVADEPAIPALFTCVVSTAGAHGTLPAALAHLARTYELRAEHWVAATRIALGPLLLLLVGGALGVVMIGLALGMISVIQAIAS